MGDQILDRRLELETVSSQREATDLTAPDEAVRAAAGGLTDRGVTDRGVTDHDAAASMLPAPLKGEELSPLRGALGRVRRDDHEGRETNGRPARPPRRLLRPRHARDPRQLELGFAAAPLSPQEFQAPPELQTDPTPDASDSPSSEARRGALRDLSIAGDAPQVLAATAASPTAVARIQPASPRAGSSSSSSPKKERSLAVSSFGLARAALASSFEADALAADRSSPISTSERACALAASEASPDESSADWRARVECVVESAKNAWIRLRSFLAPAPAAEITAPEKAALLVPIDGSRPRPVVATSAEPATLPWAEQLTVWGGVVVLLAVAFLTA